MFTTDTNKPNQPCCKPFADKRLALRTCCCPHVQISIPLLANLGNAEWPHCPSISFAALSAQHFSTLSLRVQEMGEWMPTKAVLAEGACSATSTNRDKGEFFSSTCPQHRSAFLFQQSPLCCSLLQTPWEFHTQAGNLPDTHSGALTPGTWGSWQGVQCCSYRWYPNLKTSEAGKALQDHQPKSTSTYFLNTPGVVTPPLP